MRATSFARYLIELGLLSHELVRRHLTKSLTNFSCSLDIRVNAIYQIFITAGNTLLQGLLEPDDIRACFSRLGNIFDPRRLQQMGFYAEKLKVQHKLTVMSPLKPNL